LAVTADTEADCLAARPTVFGEHLDELAGHEGPYDKAAARR